MNTEKNSIKNNSPRKVVGILLLLGILVGQCAGGKVPDNPSLLTLLTFLLGLIGSILVFLGKARIIIITLIISCLILTSFTVIAGPGHWNISGIWVFDILALLFLTIALFTAFGTKKQSQT